MKSKHLLLLFIFFTLNIGFVYCMQVSGFIRDMNTGEALIGANIFCKNHNIGLSSDNRGYFSTAITMPCVISISYTGYTTKNIELNTKNDTLLIVKMASDNKLSEITVTANAHKIGITSISAKELTLLPSIGGKPDLIKALQLQPGVQAPSEGMSLMIVRGGEPGQNQYLLDNVPLIYVNHMGGLFSVFNPDMINTVDFYKGNFPARHGGKLSSIVDITQREGDKSKHQGSFSLGLTDASVTFEGPLSKKTSYIVTARKTLIDAFLIGYTAINKAASYNQIVSYGFHDINAKITYRVNDKNSYSFNFYHGDDYYNMWKKPWVKPKNEPFHIYQKWGNLLMAARWSKSISPVVYTENTLSFTRYRNKSGSKFEFFNADTLFNSTQNLQMASVKDVTIRSNTKYSVSNHWNVEFGGQIGYAFFEPYHNKKIIDKVNAKIIGQTYHTIESALFIDNKINLGINFILQPSVRIAHYFNNNENFVFPEPRVNFTYLMNDNHRFNINFMQVSQSSHLVYTPSFLFKSEVWLPSNSTLPPEMSQQLSLSWYGSIYDSKYSLEASVFYKKMKNLVTLKEEYENMLELTGIENKIANNGKGTSYGLECMIRKNYGKWTGSAAYSWAYADRQFENVNFGNAYEFDYNRAHNFVINANRELNKKWNLNIVWLLQSGIPYTPALAKVHIYNPITLSNDVELIYGAKNSARMPAYHRLDIGFNHTIKTKKGNKATWSYSIYNLYNNINPYTNFYANNDDFIKFIDYSKPLKQYKYGFFTIIPSIAYNVYFDFDKSKPKPKPEKPQKSENRKFNWLYME